MSPPVGDPPGKSPFRVSLIFESGTWFRRPVPAVCPPFFAANEPCSSLRKLVLLHPNGTLLIPRAIRPLLQALVCQFPIAFTNQELVSTILWLPIDGFEMRNRETTEIRQGTLLSLNSSNPLRGGWESLFMALESRREIRADERRCHFRFLPASIYPSLIRQEQEGFYLPPAATRPEHFESEVLWPEPDGKDTFT